MTGMEGHMDVCKKLRPGDPGTKRYIQIRGWEMAAGEAAVETAPYHKVRVRGLQKRVDVYFKLDAR